MIKGFMTKGALIDYVNKLNEYDRFKFNSDLISYINYGNFWYLHNRAKIIELLYGFKEERQLIVGIKNQASDAMKIGEPKFLYLGINVEYTPEETIDLYNKYLEIVYKNTFYFTKVYTISHMFEAMAFDGFFPDVEGVVTGTYNGRHQGFKKDELVKKYVNMILSIDSTFDSEWTLLKKFDTYKLG